MCVVVVSVVVVVVVIVVLLLGVFSLEVFQAAKFAGQQLLQLGDGVGAGESGGWWVV